MGLKRAIELLPCDRATQTALRDVVRFLGAHTGEWFDSGHIARVSVAAPEQVDVVLEVLCRTFVIDCSGVPAQYRFEGDRVTRFEIEGFLRRADRNSGAVQSNVERFRERYGR
jgi:hypothetical protein